MVETVSALLMIIEHEIKEHRIQESLSMCLKRKRVAERQLKSETVSYKCIKSKAEIEIYQGERFSNTFKSSRLNQ